MAFWDVTNAAKPKGIKDANATLDYPVDFSAWLTDISDTYQSHTVVNLTGGITVPSSQFSSGKIVVWVSGGTVSETASFTIRITTAGGRIDDRTFYLKIVER